MTGDPQQLRQYVARIAPTLRDEPDSAKVRNLSETLARNLDASGRFGLMKLAQAIPMGQMSRLPEYRRQVQRLGSGQPIVPRDGKTDEAVRKLLEGAENAIVAIEEYQARVASNAELSRDERRNIVLRTIAAIDEQNGSQEIWQQDVQWNSGLSQQQVDDAIEHWHTERVLRSNEEPARYPEGTVWRFWFTSRGRDLAEKGPSPRQAMPAVVFQEFHHSQVASGVTQGGEVTQSVKINPDIAEIVAALQQLQQAAEESPETAAVATLAREAESELRTSGWSTKAGALLSGVGSLVQSAAALKPAYQTLQPLAAAHGLALPVWP